MLNTNITEIVSFCHSVFSHSLRKTQRENLGRAVVALTQGHDAHLSTLARSWPGEPSFKYRLKRLDRFLSNGKVRVYDCFAPLVPRILKLAVRIEGYLPILVDHTDVGQDLRVFYAAVLFKRRALPLCFFVFNKRQIRYSQNKIEEALLEVLHALVPARIKVVLVADRGFGRVALFRFIEQTLRWQYVIRVKGKVTVAHGNFRGLLYDLPTLKVRRGVRYHKTARHKLNLVCCGAGNKDPWYLATNLTDATLVQSIYEKRMRIEELFRDQKWHLDLDVPTTRNLNRFTLLLFIALLATLLLLLLGQAVLRYPTLVRQLIVCADSAGLLWLAAQTLRYGSPLLLRRLMKRAVRQLQYAL